MAMKYLGESFDLHGGGEDLAFPHHENEIAQAESLTGKIFARHWMHVRFLLVESDKMSKSAGNFHTLRGPCAAGSQAVLNPFPAGVRSLPQASSTSLLPDWSKAQSPWKRLRTFDSRIRMSQLPAGTNPVAQEAAAKAKQEMRAGMDDDLNTAYAAGAIFDMVREANILGRSRRTPRGRQSASAGSLTAVRRKSLPS